MPVTDHPAHGTLLQLKITSTFTTIGLRAEIGGMEPELKTRDVTHLDSTYVTKRATLPDLGKLSFKLWFDPNDTVTHTVLRAKIYTPPAAPDEWKLIYNDGDTTPANDDFKGILTKFTVTPGGPMDTVTADCEIELTDLFTPTAGTP
jgi:hypothetical protein